MIERKRIIYLAVIVAIALIGVFWIETKKEELAVGANTIVSVINWPASSLGNNTLLASGASVGQVNATSSPTVGYLFATSSVATSTFSGGVSVLGNGIQLSATGKMYQNGDLLMASDYSTHNVSLGRNAMPQVTSGTDNMAFGFQAMHSLTVGINNTAMGSNALFTSTDGNDNVALGANSLYYTTSGSENVAIGSLSLIANTTGNGNVAIGKDVMSLNIIGYSNTAVGHSALYNGLFGSYNAVLGYFASNQVRATSTTAIGAYAGYGGGIVNNFGGTYLGYGAGYQINNNANYNTFLGHQAGYNVTSGAGNLIIGANINAPSATLSKQLNIGNLIFGSNLYYSAEETPTMSSSPTTGGKMGIGTTTPYARLSIEGDTGGTFAVFAISTSSNGTATSTIFRIDGNGVNTNKIGLFAGMFSYEDEYGFASTTATTAGKYYPILGYSTTSPSYVGKTTGGDYFIQDFYNGSTTVLVAGVYRLTFIGGFSTNKAAEIHMDAYKNGVELKNCANHVHVSNPNEGETLTINCFVRTSANDFFDVYVKSDQASTLISWDSLNYSLEKVSDL